MVRSPKHLQRNDLYCGRSHSRGRNLCLVYPDLEPCRLRSLEQQHPAHQLQHHRDPAHCRRVDRAKGQYPRELHPHLQLGKVATATYYRLYVSGPGGVVLDQWYQAVNICNATTCSVASPTLAGGAYSWYVQTYSPAGYGPWSNNTQPTNFNTTMRTVPLGAVLTTPTGTITSTNPIYTWNKANMAVWYRLYVRVQAVWSKINGIRR